MARSFVCSHKNLYKTNCAKNSEGLQFGEMVEIDSATNLTNVIKFDNAGYVESISMCNPVRINHRNELVIVGGGPKGLRNGSGYLRFTDKDGVHFIQELYWHEKRKYHLKLSYVYSPIVKIEWSDYAFKESEEDKRNKKRREREDIFQLMKYVVNEISERNGALAYQSGSYEFIYDEKSIFNSVTNKLETETLWDKIKYYELLDMSRKTCLTVEDNSKIEKCREYWNARPYDDLFEQYNLALRKIDLESANLLVSVLDCMLPSYDGERFLVANTYIKENEIGKLSDEVVEFLAEVYKQWCHGTMIKTVYCLSEEAYSMCYEQIKGTGLKCCNIVAEKRLKAMDDNEKKQREEIVEIGKHGENEVRYALKWLDKRFSILPETDEKILIKNPSFVDEPQEFDHIVICDGFVALIETKNLSGNITITEDGQWIRHKQDGRTEGMISPIQQVRRHEKLIKSIFLEEVVIKSVICLANEKTIIYGSENSSVPIIKSDLIEAYIDELETKTKRDTKLSKEEILSIIAQYRV